MYRAGAPGVNGAQASLDALRRKKHEGPPDASGGPSINEQAEEEDDRESVPQGQGAPARVAPDAMVRLGAEIGQASRPLVRLSSKPYGPSTWRLSNRFSTCGLTCFRRG